MFITINAGPGSGKSRSLTTAFLLLDRRIQDASFATEEQRAIFDFIQEELPSKPRAAFFSHTTTVRDHLTTKLPKTVPIKTFHGHGQSQLIKMYGYQQFTKTRTDDFISDITGRHLRDLPQKMKWEWVTIKKVVNYFKQEFMEPSQENLDYCLMKYPDLSTHNLPDDWQSRCTKLMQLCSVQNRKVEFLDMVWLAAKRIKRPYYDIGFVDEHQDMGGATFELVRRMCKHVVFCGDPNQAINAFAGADESMFKKVEAHSDAVFPLKTTFRCPLNIIDKANDLIPGSVSPGPNKEIGDDKRLTYGQFLDHLPKQEPKECLVLCRTNAPLVSFALRLRTQGIAVKLADKDLSSKLISFVKSLRCGRMSGLEGCLDEYVRKQSKRKNPLCKLLAQDQASCILALSKDCMTLEALYEKIKEVIDVPRGEDTYLFATLHKAKGLEAKNIYIIDPPIEHPLAMEHPIAREQERNLHFVGITRTKLNLYWVAA